MRCRYCRSPIIGDGVRWFHLETNGYINPLLKCHKTGYKKLIHPLLEHEEVENILKKYE
jgi:hypothetical protein